MVTAYGQALSSLSISTLSQVHSIANSTSCCTNAGCVLVYIPSLVGGAYIWAAVLQKGYLSDEKQGYSLHNRGGLSEKFSCWNM